MNDGTSYEISTHASIRDVGEREYRSLLTAHTPPFLRFEWLDALETSGAVRAETGWLPQLVAVHRLEPNGARQLVAVAPTYVKGHSDGEFVFDHSWAQFAESRLGLPYYPKLVVAVPFTPATGPRVVVAPGQDPGRLRSVVGRALPELCAELGLSSAHVLFPEANEAEQLGEAGLLRRFGVQFHWQNAGYASFDDFLGRFNAKRRAALRRERREMDAQGIELCVHTGTDIDEEVARLAYSFYLSTVDKYVWGRRYLNQRFFETVAETMPEHLHVVIARERSSRRPLGGAFNLLGADALYGRYWGCVEERPFLHFNACFYVGIEECIRRGLAVFEPGAGGEHKLARGFEPTVTHSAHHLADPRLARVVADFLERERRAVLEHIDESRRDPVLRPL